MGSVPLPSHFVPDSLASQDFCSLGICPRCFLEHSESKHATAVDAKRRLFRADAANLWDGQSVVVVEPNRLFHPGGRHRELFENSAGFKHLPNCVVGVTAQFWMSF